MDNTIINLSNKTNAEVIEFLKEKAIDIPAWSDLQKEYDQDKHPVNDKSIRPDKVRKDGVDKVSRISLAMQKLIVRRMTEFMFAIPVRRLYSNINENPTRQAIANAIESIYKYSRINPENIKRSRNLFASCEFCTLWYAVEKPNTLYGFKSKQKLKCKTYSSMDGYKLYPLLDEFDDMIAMSFEYSKMLNKKTVYYFETYTGTNHYRWEIDGADWDLVLDEKITLGKIPCVYVWRPEAIYTGLSGIVSEIEFTLSRNSDIIAYNAAPVLKVAGALQGREDKGESQRVYRTEAGGDVAYVSWQQSVEAIKYQVEMLLRMFFMQSQMPDISFENMKGLGAVSGESRKTLLTDAHLKVGDEQGPFIEAFERETNIIKAFLKVMNPAWASEIDNVEVEHIITPFIQNDETADIDKFIKANGGKSLLSHLESIEQAGLSANPKQTFESIRNDEAEDARRMALTDVFNNNY